MARVDDYINAGKLAVADLAKKDFNRLAKCSGFETKPGNIFRIPFLNRTYLVDYPKFNFVDESDETKEVPIQEQVLILHYLMPDFEPGASGKWIAYREIKGASFYFSAFVKRAIDPLKNIFGRDIQKIEKPAQLLGGKKLDTGDAGFEFFVLPKAPLQLILWEGDEDFLPEANILFDGTIAERFSPEDAAWYAGMLVYRLAALSS